MFLRLSTGFIIALACAVAGCGKKKKEGDVSASLMKSKATAVSLKLADSETKLMVTGPGSNNQSFTPTSLKIPIFGINVCKGSDDCKSIYTCGAGITAGCAVELANIDAFVDALNAAPSQLEEGETYDHIGVQFCPDGDSSGIQHLTLDGTVDINGTQYATDPTEGLVEGTIGKDVEIDVQGGCASFYPISPSFTVSESTPTVVKLFSIHLTMSMVA